MTPPTDPPTVSPTDPPTEPPQTAPTCESGYELNTAGDGCVDIDECITNADNCIGEMTICNNNDGGFTCECDTTKHSAGEGVLNDEGTECVDVLSCTVSSLESIHSNVCYNINTKTHGVCTEGYFEPPTCTCEDGWTMADDRSCNMDIDECTTDPSACNGGNNAQCINSEGSYFCQCNEGYSISSDDADICIDIDECSTDPSACNGGLHAECINNDGSYFCQCEEGFAATADDSDVCIDIDECSSDPSACNGGNNAECINEEGSYFCQCNDGYSASADDTDVCIDIDECSDASTNDCDTLTADCINHDGGYHCECKMFMAFPDPNNDKTPCVDIDECMVDGDELCGDDFICINNVCMDGTCEEGFICEPVTTARPTTAEPTSTEKVTTTEEATTTEKVTTTEEASTTEKTTTSEEATTTKLVTTTDNNASTGSTDGTIEPDTMSTHGDYEPTLTTTETTTSTAADTIGTEGTIEPETASTPVHTFSTVAPTDMTGLTDGTLGTLSTQPIFTTTERTHTTGSTIEPETTHGGYDPTYTSTETTASTAGYTEGTTTDIEGTSTTESTTAGDDSYAVTDDPNGADYTTAVAATQPFTIDIEVSIPCKFAWDDDYSDPNSDAYAALYDDIFNFINTIFGGLLDYFGLHLEIELTVRPPSSPFGRRRRSDLNPSVDVHVRMHGDAPVTSDDTDGEAFVNDAVVAVQEETNVAITNGVSGYIGDFIDESGADSVEISPAGVTMDHVTGINCMYNNGGCSHFCNHFEQRCECPTCWELGLDGVTCGVQSDLVKLTCSAHGFDVEVDQCVFDGGAGDVIELAMGGDDGCIGSDVNGTHLVHAGLDSCGSVAGYGLDGELIFRNQIEVISRESAFGIRTSTNVVVPITCEFDSNYVTDHDMSILEGGVTSGATSDTTGSFEFDITMMADASVSQEFTGDRVIGDMHYFTVTPREFPTNLQYEVTKCTVTDSDGASFPILDGCASDVVSGQVIQGQIADTDESFAMAYRAFVFNGDGGDHQLTLSCDITVCTLDTCPVICS